MPWLSVVTWSYTTPMLQYVDRLCSRMAGRIQINFHLTWAIETLLHIFQWHCFGIQCHTSYYIKAYPDQTRILRYFAYWNIQTINDEMPFFRIFHVVLAAANLPEMVWVYESRYACYANFKCCSKMYAKKKQKLWKMHLMDNNTLVEKYVFPKKFLLRHRHKSIQF